MDEIKLQKEIYVPTQQSLSKEAIIFKIQTNLEIPKLDTRSYELHRQYCLNYILLAFDDLQLQVHLEKETPLPLLTDRALIHKKYYHLMKYLFKQLESEGFISYIGLETWRLLEPFPDRYYIQNQLDQLRELLYNVYPERRDFLTLCSNCGSNLSFILKDEKDPHSYLFSDNDDGVDYIYSKLPEVEWRDGILMSILRSLKSSNLIQVLEISTARDTTTTERVLSAIQHLCHEYTITKPSNAYLRAITSKVPTNVHVHSLNIEYDPKLQDFIPRSYDVIIAVNCLHTTKNARNALSNISMLLKNNGTLLLCERTQPVLGLDITFGLLNDWWRFEKSDRIYPLLQCEQWIQLFEQVGYHSCSSFESSESIIIGKYSAASPLSLSPWVISCADDRLADNLTKLLGGEVVRNVQEMMPSSVYAGIICVCDNDDTGRLELLGKALSPDILLQTKLLIIIVNNNAPNKHSLYVNMSEEAAKVFGKLSQNLKYTIMECDGLDLDALVGLDFQIFQELWRSEHRSHVLFRGSQGYVSKLVDLGPGELTELCTNLESLDKIDFVIIQDEQNKPESSILSLLEKDGKKPHIVGSCAELIQRHQELNLASTILYSVNNTADFISVIFRDLCQIQQVSTDLRIISISAQFEPMNWFCKGLVQYRERQSLAGSFVTISSDVLESVPPSLLTNTAGVASIVNLVSDGLDENDSTSLDSSYQVPGKNKQSSLLIGKSEDEQLNLVRKIVIGSLAEVSGLCPEEVDETRGFQEMGLDSVMILHLVNKLESVFQIELQVTSIFDQPTPLQLITFLVELHDNERKKSRRQSSFVLFEEDIAIIGCSCRVGPADSMEGFWKILAQGRDCITEIPESRFDYKVYDKLIYNRWGSFINNVDGFDCNFFQISPNEADVVDPQHRLLLQLAWEALEDACIPPDSLEGSKTGVFIGMCNNDYKEIVNIPEQATGSYCVTSNLQSVAAGRLSYFLGLQGPSICIDTACSSSLVAVHLACSSLRLEESKLAIVGGVNLILSPNMYINYCKAKMLSNGKVCRPFDNAADGFIRGEGCGIIILKKLTDAWTDGDNVISVIRGSGVNQDGASAGLTAPNGQAQSQLIRRTINKANMSPTDIGYIEAHGTGTVLGDPIELNALQTVFGDCSTRPPLYIGSVKANVGHLEGAAGIVGLLKVCLALKYHRIPPQINLNVINQHFTNQSGFHFPKQSVRWDKNRIGCVSSFGVSGTNAFVIVEEAPDYSRLTYAEKYESHHLFTISAKSQPALENLLETYSKLTFPSHDNFGAVAYTSNVGRTHFRHRISLVAKDADDFHKQLSNKSYLKFGGATKSQICFLFTGQGSHYAGMGKVMYDTHPYFRETFEHCSTIIDDMLGSRLCDMFDDDQNIINDFTLSQVALFALEYSTAMLWIKIGIHPTHLIGHSFGEYVAAAVAEALAVPDAVSLVITRARLIQERLKPNDFGMMAVAPDTWNKYSENGVMERNELITVAAVNSPKQIVISGPISALMSLKNEPCAGIMLNVQYGYHSKQMQSIKEEFRKEALNFKHSRPKINLISSVTGKPITEFDGNYWAEHLVQPVNFHDAFKYAFTTLGCTTYLEVGPKPVLITLGKDLIQDSSPIELLYSMTPKENNWISLLKTAGALYVLGLKLNFNELYPCRKTKVSLPVYPFEKRRCWAANEITLKTPVVCTVHDESVHPLLGRLICSTNKEAIYENQLAASAHLDYLKGHAFISKIILPGSAFIEVALSAVLGGEKFSRGVKLTNFTIELPLVLDAVESVPICTMLTHGKKVEIHSTRSKSKWKLFASCKVGYAQNTTPAKQVDLQGIKEKLGAPLNSAIIWEHFDKTEGVEFGPSFKAIKNLRLGQAESLVEINMELDNTLSSYNIHPVLLDNAFQSVFSTLIVADIALINQPFMVSNVDEIIFWCKCPSRVVAHVTSVKTEGASGISADISIISALDGVVVLEIKGFHGMKTTRDNFERLTADNVIEDGLYEERWLITDEWSAAENQLGVETLNTVLSRKIKYVGENDYYEDLCVQYIWKALSQLHIERHLCVPANISELCSRAGIDPRQGALVEHFFRTLNFSQDDSGRWTLPGNFEAGLKIQTCKDSIQAQCGEALFGLCNICGEQLQEILRGNVNPLELLFPLEGSPTFNFSAEAVYKQSPGINHSNGLLHEVLSELLTKYNQNNPLHILEIGAGTGSTSKHILDTLRAGSVRFNYVYTDISSSFFPSAKDQFGTDNINYKVLNIENDPYAQGFVPFQYDILVAANVLHATQNILTTINYARRLLRPGGLFLIMEATKPSLVLDLTFGLTDGWWRFCGLDQIRRDYPLMSCKVWEKILLASNFNHVRYLDLEESIIIGKASDIYNIKNQSQLASIQPVQNKVPSQPWLLVLFEQSGDNLREMLQSMGESIISASYSVINQLILPAVLRAVVFDSGACVDVRTMAETLLKLTQLLVKSNVQVTNKFVILTHEAVPAQGLRPLKNPFQAILWGMCKTIQTEHPELKCTAMESEDSLGIIQEVYRKDNETMVLIGKEDRRVARLNQVVAVPREHDSLFRPDGTYLITGGSGGLALALVRWLYVNGARNVCILSRRLTEIGNCAELEGLSIQVFQCDVSDIESLRQVILGINPTLRGIFHLAGALSDAALLNQTWTTIEHTYKAKVFGAWNLHQLTSIEQNLTLDYFVLFSSLASLIGSGGQINHASANSFLDALVHYRVDSGLPGLSINWGVWAEIGSAQGRKLIPGLKSFSPEFAFSALEFALSSKRTQLVVSKFDWNVYDTRDSNWYRDVKPVLISQEQDDDQVDDFPVPSKQETKKSSSVMPTTQKTMQKLISQLITKLTGFTEVSTDVSFLQLGIDSLMVIELRNRLQTQLKLTIPVTVLFENPTVDTLSRKLFQQVATSAVEQNDSSAQNSNEIAKTKPLNIDGSSNKSTEILKISNTSSMAETITSLPEKPRVSNSNPINLNSVPSLPSPALKPSPIIRKPANYKGSINLDYTTSKHCNGSINSYETCAPTIEFVPSNNQTTHSQKLSGSGVPEIAVIGMACKIGVANNLDEYWRLLMGELSSISRIPATRVEARNYYSNICEEPPYGSFINGHDLFDHQFFGTNPKEAGLMDPQQRLLLQLTWHALEHAGIPPDSLKSSKTGLFIGINGNDYSHLLTRKAATTQKLPSGGAGDDTPFLSLLGNTHCIASGRIAHFFGFQGPVMSIDTACSSSFAALHLAVQSLRSGEVNLAVVGGSNLLLSHDKFVGYDRGRMLSTDGMTKSFDSEAAGFVRGEGLAVVVLKRLAEGDQALALIKGSAICHSGVGSGLGAPNADGQIYLLREALKDANMHHFEVDYIEAQGSASTISDAIELNALEVVYGNPQKRQSKIILGAVKPSIGHLEAASGLAGLIKVILAMQTKQIPPLFGFKMLNPEVANPNFMNISSTVQKWPSQTKMVAGVSSMGYGGTNVHAIIQNPSLNFTPSGQSLPPPFLFTISAKTKSSLSKLVHSYQKLNCGPDTLSFLAQAMNTTRTHFPQHRIAIVASTEADYLLKLNTVDSNFNAPLKSESISFSMGGNIKIPLQMYENIPIFKKHLNILSQVGMKKGVGIQNHLCSESSLLKEFASQYILAAVLIELGIMPEKVSGIGVGELVAACLTNLLTLDDAMNLVVAKGRDKPKHVTFQRRDSLIWINNSTGKNEVKPNENGARKDEADSPQFVSSGVPVLGTIDRGYWADKCRTNTIGQSFNIVVDLHVNKIGDWSQFVLAIADMYERRSCINFAALYAKQDVERLSLPLYPFEPSPHWYNNL